MAIQRILCPVDFSSCSDQALQSALKLAKGFGATLELMHVVQTPTYVMPMMPLGGVPVDLMRDQPERLKAQLDKVRDRHLSEHSMITTSVHEGVVHAKIIERAQETAADLIVIGTHGHTGLTHVLLGSVAERVVRMAPCPVLTIGPGQAGQSDVKAGREKILCPIDFSTPSMAALDYAVTLARTIKADLHITHVIPLLAYAVASKEPVDNPGFEARIRQDVKERLAALQQKLSSDSLAVTVSSVDGVPYEAIQRTADDQRATMIVIGTHGHTGLDRWLLGSVAEKVVRTARIPVLAVRTVTGR